MATKIEIFTHYLSEVQKILNELDYYKNTSEFFYREVMEDLVKRYNALLKKYYKSTGIPLEVFELNSFDLSNTKKTVRDSAIERFKINLNATKNLIDSRIQYLIDNDTSKEILSNQMRKCLNSGTQGCSKKPQLENRRVFIGMPFDGKYLDSYQYGIKLALELFGLIPYKADNDISSGDIMCKICEEMQKCKYLIFNISGLNPNVMLELGLSYGLGKETIVIKEKGTKNISDIAGIEYIEYSHAGELRDHLIKFFGK